MLQTLRRLVLIFAAALIAPAIAAQDTVRPVIGNKIEAYTGRQNVQVKILRVGERSANQALVQISGIDHDWDKRIQRMDIEKTFKDVRYSVEVNGKRHITLIMSNEIGELYLPGENQQTNIFPNSSLGREGNPEHFLTDFLQQSDGA